MRSVDELMATTDPAWPRLEAELTACPAVQIRPIGEAAGRESLHRLQVSARSRMGALALHTSGLLVDDGWLRVLGGSDGSALPSLAEANGLPGDERAPMTELFSSQRDFAGRLGRAE